jgi:hypothetical protein
MKPKAPKGWVLMKVGETIQKGYMWNTNLTNIWKKETNPADRWIGKKYVDGLRPFARRLPAKRGKKGVRP